MIQKEVDLKDEFDGPVKCCRCRNKHQHSDRVESKPNEYGLCMLQCPRCGAAAFYKLDEK